VIPPQPIAVAPIRLVEPSRAQLGTWRPKQDLGGGGLRGVVEVAADQHVVFLSMPLELLCGPGPNRDGLGGPLVQGVQAEAGAYGLVASVELRMLGSWPGKVSSLDFKWAVRACTTGRHRGCR
jgi:hypothetical protein